MKNTLSIHGTGNFLSWHRYYTYAYESALRTECGYNGTQPVSIPLVDDASVGVKLIDVVLGLGPLQHARDVSDLRRQRHEYERAGGESNTQQ